MSKNLYRVGKKSDLDEIIKNNFFKPICIVFTSKEIEKEFEDKIANIFKEVSKKNTYCMYLLINLDNFIDNINFFNQMKINSPNFIAYFKGKQIEGDLIYLTFNSFSQKVANPFSSVASIRNKYLPGYIIRWVYVLGPISFCVYPINTPLNGPPLLLPFQMSGPPLYLWENFVKVSPTSSTKVQLKLTVSPEVGTAGLIEMEFATSVGA